MGDDKMREEFESSPRFKGMDFTRADTHPEYYESPYANGARDGWKASREALVIELPADIKTMAGPVMYADDVRAAVEAAGLMVTHG
ncbi:hypothetical protein PS918_03110 [Pseudomonas fluorescens]|uniref:Uncharacterized protein n=1 Tax=Pseudomonas fluorescens TaxID=294 RepID=A0A5E7STD9_PSEFL|nr:hypothetical protein [Pseudomonas fluorescens]VVP89686.1 hypothetical protein PS918_03110 [Pseudomonas fluorescens]